MLLTGLGDELCGLLITCLLSALLPFQSLFTESSFRVQLLAPPSFSGALTAPFPLYCMFLFSFLFIIWFFFFFFAEQESVCPGCYTDLFQEWLWGYHVMLGAHLGLPNVFQAALELASGNTGPLLFSQCNMAWKSFVQVGGSGCQGFDSSWFFFFC
jgi:hypothetical protein